MMLLGHLIFIEEPTNRYFLFLKVIIDLKMLLFIYRYTDGISFVSFVWITGREAFRIL